MAVIIQNNLGVTLLKQLQLDSLIASSISEYIQMAINLANKPNMLRKLRAELRQSMAESALCDGVKFTKYVEAEYRKMWQKWVKKQSPTAVKAGAA